MKSTKWPYLAHFSSKWKNKTTFFSSNFKVEEKKVVLFFHFELKRARYGHFLNFKIFVLKVKSWETLKWPYLTHFSLKWKNKNTFLSSTLKFEEKKVVLFFHFELKWVRYGHFYVSQLLTFKTKIMKLRNWPYLALFSSK